MITPAVLPPNMDAPQCMCNVILDLIKDGVSLKENRINLYDQTDFNLVLVITVSFTYGT